MVQLASEYPQAFSTPDSIVQPPVAQLLSDPKGQLPGCPNPLGAQRLVDAEGQGLLHPPLVHGADTRQRLEPQRPRPADRCPCPRPARQGRLQPRRPAARAAVGPHAANAQGPLHLRLPYPHRAIPGARTRNGTRPSPGGVSSMAGRGPRWTFTSGTSSTSTAGLTADPAVTALGCTSRASLVAAGGVHRVGSVGGDEAAPGEEENHLRHGPSASRRTEGRPLEH